MRPDMEQDIEGILSSDYFRMFVFKVEKCSRMDPHDWTMCQFAHPTEKAKRRDPTKFVYNHTSCTEFRKHGTCRSGDNCSYAHGVFEGWLSTAKYHTEMCTLGQPACTRRVCFFAHSPSELRETVPETLEETAQLRDRLLEDMLSNPTYAKKLQNILNGMTPAQASEIIGERLANLQFFLNQFGPSALPALLKCSHSDLQDLKGSLTTQAQQEAVGEQMTEAQLSQMLEADALSSPLLQQLSNLYNTMPLSDAHAANLISRISISNPPSVVSDEQYSGRSSMDSYFGPPIQNQMLTPNSMRSTSLSSYAKSLGDSSATHEARSSIDSAETARTGPRRTNLRVGNLFGLPPTPASNDTYSHPRPPVRHSLDNAYQQALVAKQLGTPVQSPMQSPMQSPLNSNTSPGYLSPLTDSLVNASLLSELSQRSGSVDFHRSPPLQFRRRPNNGLTSVEQLMLNAHTPSANI